VIEIHAPSKGEGAWASEGAYTWWVDKQRSIVLREDTRSKVGTRMSSMVFEVAKVNEPLPESLFQIPAK
jgi:hypothetical protein